MLFAHSQLEIMFAEPATQELLLGPPVVPFYPFLGEGSPTKINYRIQGTLILTSLLEDLTQHMPASEKIVLSLCLKLVSAVRFPLRDPCTGFRSWSVPRHPAVFHFPFGALKLATNRREGGPLSPLGVRVIFPAKRGFSKPQCAKQFDSTQSASNGPWGRC